MTNTDEGPDARPLRGIRVIDLTTVLLGPYAAQMLGDYGADVIKVEAPEGDSTRSTGPAREPGMAATFMGANSSKRSIVLDLKQPPALEAMLRLLAGADVFLCSVRPQKLRALGLGPEQLRERFPRLVVVSIVGFGEDGPYAGRPAYDDIIQGLCGLASLTERQGGAPAYVPTVIADKTCGLFAVQAVLLALVQRAATGLGCQVQVPMFEAMASFTLVEHLYGRTFKPPEGDAGYDRLLTRWRKPYPTTDGYVCIVPYSTQHWQRFFEQAGRPDLMRDARFGTLAARTQNIDALYGELAACTPARSTAQWLETCERLDIPAAPMHRLQDLEQDPHLQATGFFRQMSDPVMGDLTLPSPPLRFDGRPASSGMPPRLGEHTREVLHEAGLATDTIERLLDTRAAVQAVHHSLHDSRSPT
ncbi:CaiB/BaiF CoA-transferase family protein [Variovorax sp. KK3]|uniref:CaiB/BaiF CoA transferase family protein n=1 Tax=Variovorax sp. KK3 TaxID=1855728 RepID=UPI00097BFE03|nr:CoA transferase [Variovorax sp. KK3]